VKDNISDCLVIGGGPAGLAAAIYLARFRLSVAVVDGGRSRAESIPMVRNYPGFPCGIAGKKLMSLMRHQATQFGATYCVNEVHALEKTEEFFVGHASARTFRARTVILATGMVDRQPNMPTRLRGKAVAEGLLRYCPICDGYEITDKPVAVLGTSAHATKEAKFIRTFTSEVSLIAPDGAHRIDRVERARLSQDVEVLDGPCTILGLSNGRVALQLPSGVRWFASVYVALGTDPRSELATALGGQLSPWGYVLTDEHQRTRIPSVYAVGDVVEGLSQISHATGQSGVAATAVRNELASATAS